MIALGGKELVILEPLKQNRIVNRFLHEDSSHHPIWKLLFSHTSSYLYAAYDEGVVKRFRKESNVYKLEKCIMMHRNDIEDCDLDLKNQYLITASQDHSVGFTCVGSEHQMLGNFEETGTIQ